MNAADYHNHFVNQSCYILMQRITFINLQNAQSVGNLLFCYFAEIY